MEGIFLNSVERNSKIGTYFADWCLVLMKETDIVKYSFIPVFALAFIFLAFSACKTDPSGKHASDNHSHQEHKHKHGDHSHEGANAHMNKSSFEELVKRFEDPERDAYQKPDEVLSFLGRLGGKKVMDLGAGTGYFSTRLAKAGAQVIAADINQRFLDHIKDRREAEKIPTASIELRKVPENDPLLKKEEVDKVLLVNTYHHINDRVEYFKKVREGLKAQGELVVIDFKKQDDDIGPPKHLRLSSNEVATELKMAGYPRIKVDVDLLEKQYIVRAFK